MRQKLIEGVQDYSAMNTAAYDHARSALRDCERLRRKSIPVMFHKLDLSGS